MNKFTVSFKYNNKIFIGILDKNGNISDIEKLVGINHSDYIDNTFHILAYVDERPSDLVEVYQVKYDIESVTDDADFISLTNIALKTFHKNTSIH